MDQSAVSSELGWLECKRHVHVLVIQDTRLLSIAPWCWCLVGWLETDSDILGARAALLAGTGLRIAEAMLSTEVWAVQHDRVVNLQGQAPLGESANTEKRLRPLMLHHILQAWIPAVRVAPDVHISAWFESAQNPTKDGGEDVAGAVSERAVLCNLERIELDDRIGLVEAVALAAQERLRHLPREARLHIRHAGHLLLMCENVKFETVKFGHHIHWCRYGTRARSQQNVIAVPCAWSGDRPPAAVRVYSLVLQVAYLPCGVEKLVRTTSAMVAVLAASLLTSSGTGSA